MKEKIRSFMFVIARKLGYVSQNKAALGFAEGWYMSCQQKEACWQSVEEAFANSDLQESLAENIKFRKGKLTQSYFNSLSLTERLSFSKCIGQKEGYVLVPVKPTPKMIDTTWNDDDQIQSMCHNSRNEFIYKAMIKAAQEGE